MISRASFVNSHVSRLASWKQRNLSISSSSGSALVTSRLMALGSSYSSASGLKRKSRCNVFKTCSALRGFVAEGWTWNGVSM